MAKNQDNLNNPAFFANLLSNQQKQQEMQAGLLTAVAKIAEQFAIGARGGNHTVVAEPAAIRPTESDPFANLELSAPGIKSAAVALVAEADPFASLSAPAPAPTPAATTSDPFADLQFTAPAPAPGGLLPINPPVPGAPPNQP